jgi:Bacterial SH3 domain
MKHRRPFIAGVLLLAALTFVSCARKQQENIIELPPTPVVKAAQQWGVVTSPQLRLREAPSIDAKALITLWKGYEVEIVDRTQTEDTISGMSDYWYNINYRGLGGWVFGYYLDLYDSKQRADAAAKELK